MSHLTTAATSPLNCRWIEPGSRRSIEAFEYAVCRRQKDAERVVNEAECRYCPAWEPPVAARPASDPGRRGPDRR
jgi:hypothetical protein